MQTFEKTIHLYQYEDYRQLGQPIVSLIEEACRIRSASYAPYSDFPVGAAVLLANGELVGGCNQENRAFPSGLCAERVAFFSAGSLYPGVPVRAMALYSEVSKETDFITPCGGCRQVMYEFEERQQAPIGVYTVGVDQAVWYLPGITNLLPFPFVHETNSR